MRNNEELLDEYRLTSNRALKDTVVLQNQKLINYVLSHYFKSYVKKHKEDLYQEGCIALMEAVEHYDPKHGTKFSTYAVPWIRQACHRFVEERRPEMEIKIPTHIRVIQRKIRKEIENGDRFKEYNILEELNKPELLSSYTAKMGIRVKAAFINNKAEYKPNIDVINESDEEKELCFLEMEKERKDFIQLVRNSFNKLSAKEKSALLIRYVLL